MGSSDDEAMRSLEEALDDALPAHTPMGMVEGTIWSEEHGPRKVAGMVEETDFGWQVVFPPDTVLQDGETLSVTVRGSVLG